MLVSQEVKDRVNARLQECVETANAHFNIDIKFPNVVYKTRGTTAGTAAPQINEIDLNPILLMNNVDAFMARTVPHEMAHLITSKVYPHTNEGGWGKKRSPHGSEWKSVMRLLGADPSRCHQYDVSSVKKRTNKYEYVCEGCGEPVMMGVKRHNKHQLARIAGRNQYSHNGCKGAKLTWKPQLKGVLAAEKPVERTIKAKSPVTGTKKEHAVKIYHNLQGDRSLIISKLMNQLNMSKAGASTYYSNIKSGKWS